MDQICSDLEFFDFNDASEEEIKEIQTILKGPGSNGCVELPWEIPIKENSLEVIPQNEEVVEKADSSSSKSEKVLATVAVEHTLQFTSPPTPLSPPVARLPPPHPVDAFVAAPPTTIGPYGPNTSYFVSRTIPFVRAYPHMGVPFFACPLPGTAGDSNAPIPTVPYGQFVPMVPATVGQEKFIGQQPLEQSETVQQKGRGSSDRQFKPHHNSSTNSNNKKKLSSSEFAFESEVVTAEEQVVISNSPASTTVSCSERPTSVPLVPLPVPPSTFGGTLPLHGYPPGLHTLPYTQMSGHPQAPSAAMYYVPVFNHPYGSYIPTPPSAPPMVLPVNLRPENESTEVEQQQQEECNSEEVLKDVNNVVVTKSSSDNSSPTVVVQSNCEVNPNPSACEQFVDVSTKQEVSSKLESSNSSAKNNPALSSDVAKLTDCSASDGANCSKPQRKQTTNSLTDCIPEKVTDVKCQQPRDEDSSSNNKDSSARCWADLFKKPCPEVNGIDRSLRTTEQAYENLTSNLGKEVSNGKLYSVPASDNIL